MSLAQKRSTLALVTAVSRVSWASSLRVALAAAAALAWLVPEREMQDRSCPVSGSSKVSPRSVGAAAAAALLLLLLPAALSAALAAALAQAAACTEARAGEWCRA
jgi:2-methylcitrate dehydratase PrpD